MAKLSVKGETYRAKASKEQGAPEGDSKGQRTEEARHNGSKNTREGKTQRKAKHNGRKAQGNAKQRGSKTQRKAKLKESYDGNWKNDERNEDRIEKRAAKRMDTCHSQPNLIETSKA